jgi:hypothetical protein
VAYRGAAEGDGARRRREREAAPDAAAVSFTPHAADHAAALEPAAQADQDATLPMSPDGRLTYDQLRRWPAGKPIVERHYLADAAVTAREPARRFGITLEEPAATRPQAFVRNISFS